MAGEQVQHCVLPEAYLQALAKASSGLSIALLGKQRIAKPEEHPWIIRPYRQSLLKAPDSLLIVMPARRSAAADLALRLQVHLIPVLRQHGFCFTIDVLARKQNLGDSSLDKRLFA